MTASTKQINEFGLTEVVSPPNPLVDVVFVHGLNGHPHNTWTTHTQPEVFWPRDLLPLDVDQERCRILVYGYDANVTAFRDGTSKDHIHHHGETLAARLAANRSRLRATERPLIFVCHSLGGLVVKRMLIYCSDATHVNQVRIRSIFVSTYGILFLGTPHMGSDLAKWGSVLQSICAAVLPKKVFDSSSQLVRALETNNETLQVINREFTQLMSKFKIYFFHEARPMDLKGTRQFIVDEDSAAPNLPGVERAGIEKDHSNMCKFEDESAPGYDLVSEAIQRYAGDSVSTIPLRWDIEQQNRQLQKIGDARELGLSVPDIREITTTPPVTNNSSAQANHPPSNMGTGRLKNTLSPKDNSSGDNSVSSSKLIEPTSSRSSQGPLMVAPLGFRPNSIFKGFEIELDRIDRKLKDRRKTELGTSAILLSGPPGCGKTHLARQYVWLHRSEHPAGTFWVDCKSPESTEYGYLTIGYKIGCINENDSPNLTKDQFIDTVRTALQEQHGWILIFDGIRFQTEDEINNFIKYLPDSQGNRIIFTSVDRTLAGRQRLLVPSDVPIWSLSRKAALELLYSYLKIRRPTHTQKEKALELVRHYGYLPLGIHAAAHALIARGRPLERFTSLPSDNRLAQPFQEILVSLQTNFIEAFHLITLFSFVYHHVPVALVEFGAKFMAEDKFEVESIDRNGGIKKHLDNTIAVLISHGLVERQLQPLIADHEHDESSPESSRKSTLAHDFYAQDAVPIVPSILPQDSSGYEITMMPEEQTDSGSLSSIPSGIDTIKTHTVIQAVIRDSMKPDTKLYYMWLARASRFLQASFSRAKMRNVPFVGRNSIDDLHVYKTHGEVILRHFPPPPPASEKVPQQLFDARHELRSLLRSIDREMQNYSPTSGSSGSSRGPYRSVFERASSSSDEGPDTPRLNLSRSTTWSLSALDRRTQSPIDIKYPIPPRQPDPIIMEPEETVSGYSADASAQMSMQSDDTAIASPNNSLVRLSLLNKVLKGLPPGPKKNLGEYKPKPTVSVSPGVVEPASVSTPVSSSPPRSTLWRPFSFSKRRSSSQSTAEQALAALRDRAGSPNVDNVTSESPFEEATQRPETETPSGESTNGTSMLTPVDINAPLSPPPPLQSNQRRLSSSPRLLSAVLQNEAHAAWDRIGLPYEETIITRRVPANVAIPLRRDIAGLTDSTFATYTPPGYSSATAMSREPSNESAASVVSMPAELRSLNNSPAPGYSEALVYRRQWPSIDASMGAAMQRDLSSGSAPYPLGERDFEHESRRGSAILPMPSPSAFNDPGSGLQIGSAIFGRSDDERMKVRPRAHSRA